MSSDAPFIRFILSFFLFLAMCGSALSQDTNRISYYETATQLRFQKPQQNAGVSKPGIASTATLRFSAFGRVFDIALMPNERLVTNLRSARALPGDLNVFRGSITDVPDSWARFSLLDDRIAGVVWDGNELFLVDSALSVRNLISGSPADGETLVFRASDVQFRADRVVHHGKNGKVISGGQLVAETKYIMQSQAPSLTLPSRGIPLGLILDAEFPNLGNEERALFPTNIADGIHSEQVNLHLDVEYIHRFDYINDPFESNDATVLLDQLPGIKNSTLALAPLGLAHFLTTRDLDGAVRGIALFNSLCGINAGVGLTEVRGSVLDGIIMAHEIAHNFGAPHDGEAGSACESTPTTYLMSATINGSQQFSSCSLAQMAPVLDGATCLTEVAQGDVSLVVEPVPAGILLQQKFDLRFFVNNLGDETSFDGLIESLADSGLRFEHFTVKYRDCGNQLDIQRRACELGTLYGGESDYVDITVRPISVGLQTLRTTVNASNDLNPGNNEVTLDFDVQAASDLYPRSTVYSPNLRPGETTLITAHIYNDGAFDTDAMLTIRTSQLNSVSTSENCVVVSFRWLECQLGNVSAGSSVKRDFEFTVSADPLAPAGSSSQDVELIVSATLPDSEPGNNSYRPFVNIWGSFVDLTTQITSAPDSLPLGETGEIVLDFINNGLDMAPDGRLELHTFPQVLAESVVTSRGHCDPNPYGAICEWSDILAGEHIQVRFQFQTTSGGPHNVSAETRHTSAFDTDNDNNAANAEFESILPPPPPSPPPTASSGGGGAISFMTLLMLASVRYWARMRHKPRSGPLINVTN